MPKKECKETFAHFTDDELIQELMSRSKTAVFVMVSEVNKTMHVCSSGNPFEVIAMCKYAVDQVITLQDDDPSKP